MVDASKRSPDNFPKEVREREKRKLKRLQNRSYAWFGLGFFGLIGWSIAVPALVGIFIGLWIDSHLAGRYSWTLMLFIIGLGLGCYNGWYWLQKERESIGKQKDENDN